MGRRVDEGTERNLIKRCKKGDWSAFDRLLKEREARIYQLAYRMTGIRMDAEAVTQGVFTGAFQGLKKFHGRSRLATWLFSIAVRTVGELERRRSE